MSFNVVNPTLDLPLGSFTATYAAVSVSPVVLVAILDHYLRRSSDQPRVLGTLLGYKTDEGRVLQVTNCFPVPHTEEKDQIALDVEYHRSLFDLHQRVNLKETIVGWYATGSGLNPYAALVHDFYSKEVGGTGSAVHLNVDTDMVGDTLGVQAYVSRPVGVSTQSESCIFFPVTCRVHADSAERAAVDALGEALEKPEGTTNLMGDIEALEKAVLRLQDMLERVSDYVKNVLSGHTPANVSFGRLLMDVVLIVPAVDVGKFEQAFNSHLQDMLMVAYLSELTRSQLALTESFQTLL